MNKIKDFIADVAFFALVIGGILLIVGFFVIIFFLQSYRWGGC